MNLNTEYGSFAIEDIDDDGFIDTVAMTDENSENITFVSGARELVRGLQFKRSFSAHMSLSRYQSQN